MTKIPTSDKYIASMLEYESKAGIKLYKLASYICHFRVLLLVSLLYVVVINPHSFLKFNASWFTFYSY